MAIHSYNIQLVYSEHIVVGIQLVYSEHIVVGIQLVYIQ